MLGLLGLFGALVAGVVADAMINHESHGSDDEDAHSEGHDASGDEDAGAPDTAAQGSLLDDPDDPATDHQTGNGAGLSPDTAFGHPEAEAESGPHAAPWAHHPRDWRGQAHQTPEAGSDNPSDPTSGGSTDGMPTSSDLPDAPDDPVSAAGGPGSDRLDGWGGDDSLSGGDGNDALSGRAGTDRLGGDAGADTLDGGDGGDRLAGGSGRDSLTGGAGDDTIQGGGDDDTLSGQDGSDFLSAGAGNDSVTSGQGDDTVQAGDGNDTVESGDGNDVIMGGKGADDLSGGAGNDTLRGTGVSGRDDHAVDYLNGGAGDDLLHVGAGDYANGGEGADSYILDDHPADQDAARITDWHPGEDSLVVVYDPAAHPDPVLGVLTAQDSPDATITLDGVPIAHVAGGAGLSTSDIQLQAQAA